MGGSSAGSGKRSTRRREGVRQCAGELGASCSTCSHSIGRQRVIFADSTRKTEVEREMLVSYAGLSDARLRRRHSNRDAEKRREVHRDVLDRRVYLLDIERLARRDLQKKGSNIARPDR